MNEKKRTDEILKGLREATYKVSVDVTPQSPSVEESREVNVWEERIKTVKLAQDWEMAESYLWDYLDYKKLSAFIASEIELARREVLRDCMDWLYKNEDDAVFAKEWVGRYAKENNINLTTEE